MECLRLVLEYLKVILTAPVIFGAIVVFLICKFEQDLKALLERLAKMKFPGVDAEFSPSQAVEVINEDDSAALPDLPHEPIIGLPQDLTEPQLQAVEQIIRSYKATGYLWEYRFLNYFLVRGTQAVLDWVAISNQPIAYTQYDAFWLPLIPLAIERQNIIDALQAHHLIYLDYQMNTISISPKGREYVEWRGVLPPIEP